MATHSSILAWEIPWTEEPGGLQSMGSQRVGQDLATKQQQNNNWALCSHCGTCCLSHNQLVIQDPACGKSSSCYRKQTWGCGVHLLHSGGRGIIRRASSNSKCLHLIRRDFDSMGHDNVFQQSAIENVLCTRQCPWLLSLKSRVEKTGGIVFLVKRKLKIRCGIMTIEFGGNLIWPAQTL